MYFTEANPSSVNFSTSNLPQSELSTQVPSTVLKYLNSMNLKLARNIKQHEVLRGNVNIDISEVLYNAWLLITVRQ